jgi:hypothetical protein
MARLEVYVCDRCNAEHRNVKELTRVSFTRGGRHGRAAGETPLELCAECVKDLHAWVKPKRARTNGHRAEVEVPAEPVAA